MLYRVFTFSGKLTCQVNDCVMNHFNQPTFPQRIILYLYTTEQAQKTVSVYFTSKQSTAVCLGMAVFVSHKLQMLTADIPAPKNSRPDY